MKYGPTAYSKPKNFSSYFKQILLFLTFSESPSHHFFPAWFFSIHQYSCSVNFCGHPREEQKAKYQQYCRQSNLPNRNIISNSSHHYDRRGQWKNTAKHRHRTVWIIYSLGHPNKTNDDRHQYRHHQLLCIVLVFTYHASNRGKHGSISKISAKEIEDERKNDF